MCWGLNKTKRWMKGEFALCGARAFIFSCSQTLAPLVWGLWPWSGTCTVSPLVLMVLNSDQDLHHCPLCVLTPSGLHWSYTTSSPGPPAWRQRFMGFLSPHNYKSQSVIANPFPCVYSIHLDSLQNPSSYTITTEFIIEYCNYPVCWGRKRRRSKMLVQLSQEEPWASTDRSDLPKVTCLRRAWTRYQMVGVLLLRPQN